MTHSNTQQHRNNLTRSDEVNKFVLLWFDGCSTIAGVRRRSYDVTDVALADDDDDDDDEDGGGNT